MRDSYQGINEDHGASFVIAIECGHCCEITGIDWIERQPTKDGVWRCRSCGRAYPNDVGLKAWAGDARLSFGEDGDAS